ncbi:hypothetical protein [Neisseria perflava]|uniref:hypothetical protein n=1 Tax=Neisseria perflava TaxID=33053 RepID=UPI00209D2678|nr:hypothetical protein [Neisseria perflava]MCP1659539.1 hypothetical protein [Neisseria perflava]
MSYKNSSCAFFTIARKFLSLAQVCTDELIKERNPFCIVSDRLLSSSDIERATKWSDRVVSIPILFNFYHGLELTIKGCLCLQLQKTEIKGHKFSELIEKLNKDLIGENLFSLITKYTINLKETTLLDPNIILEFLNENEIDIDSWYEALKYPSGKEGHSFNHIALKYGSKRTLPFWEQLSSDIDKLKVLSGEYFHLHTHQP